jgi:hypothetical protein
MSQSNTILFRMPFAIAGDLSRAAGLATVEAQPLNPAAPFPGFGLPGKIVNGLFVPITSVSDVVYGFLVRPFPTQGQNPSDPLGISVPLASGLANIMRRGYIGVQNNAGNPALNGAVFMRYANGTTGTPIGGLEATFVSGSNIAITGANGPLATFMGQADATGLTDIGFNI